MTSPTPPLFLLLPPVQKQMPLAYATETTSRLAIVPRLIGATPSMWVVGQSPSPTPKQQATTTKTNHDNNDAKLPVEVAIMLSSRGAGIACCAVLSAPSDTPGRRETPQQWQPKACPRRRKAHTAFYSREQPEIHDAHMQRHCWLSDGPADDRKANAMCSDMVQKNTRQHVLSKCWLTGRSVAQAMLSGSGKYARRKQALHIDGSARYITWRQER